MSSTWKVERAKERPRLDKNIKADVAIIGGGLAGIWCAYLLSKEGKKVVLIEKDKVGGGQTEYTTAFITYAIDTSLAELAKMFGERDARLVWQSGSDAIDLIEKTVKEEKIECEFMRIPTHIFARSQEEWRQLEEEGRLAKKLGFDVSLEKDAEIGFRHSGAEVVHNQAKYHPMKFILGLADAAERYGTKIYEKTEASEIVGNAPASVLTAEGRIITAESVVIATYAPFNHPKQTLLKKGMYISYVIEFEIPPESVPEGMFLDVANPYHYLRVDKAGEEWRLIAGGEDHKNIFRVPEEKNYEALRKYVRSLFPGIDMKEVRKWKGGILEPSDGLPSIGEISRRRYIATAFSGNGMTYSPIAGMLITDLIAGRDNIYKDIYDPKRTLLSKATLYKARDYTGEFFGGAVKNIFK